MQEWDNRQKDENLEKCKPDNPIHTISGLYQVLYLRNAWLHLKLKLSPIYFKTWGKRCLAFPPLHPSEPLYVLTTQALACTEGQAANYCNVITTDTVPAVMCLQHQFTVGVVLWPTNPEHCPALSKYLLFPGVPETWVKMAPKCLQRQAVLLLWLWKAGVLSLSSGSRRSGNICI